MDSSHIDSLLAQLDMPAAEFLSNAPSDYQALIENRLDEFVSKKSVTNELNAELSLPMQEFFVVERASPAGQMSFEETSTFNDLLHHTKMEALKLAQLAKTAAETVPTEAITGQRTEIEEYMEAKISLLLAFSINLGVFGVKKLCGEEVDNSDSFRSLITLRQLIEKMRTSHKKFEALLEDADLHSAAAEKDEKLDLRPNILQELEGEEGDAARAQKQRVIKSMSKEEKEKVPAQPTKEGPTYDERKRYRKIARNSYFTDASRNRSDAPLERDFRGAEFSRKEQEIQDFEESRLKRYNAKKSFKKATSSLKSDPQLVNFGGFSEFNDLKNVFGEKSQTKPRKNFRGKRN